MAALPAMPNISPATTHCSVAEYQSPYQLEDFGGSQPRRSQRLREKHYNAKDTWTPPTLGVDRVDTGSPQLFDEIDGECSQLAQQLPIYVASQKKTRKHARNLTQDVDANHCTAVKKRRLKRAISENQEEPKMQSERVQILLATQSAPELASKHRPRKYKVRNATATKRARLKSQLKTKHIAPTTTTMQQQPTVSSTPKEEKDNPYIFQSKNSQQLPTNQVNFTSSTQTYAYQCLNMTQTLLPARYPEHFIHQLPPEPKYSTGMILPDELHRVSSGDAVQLREKCVAPTQAHEPQSTSPPNAQFVGSRTPSLSESLAELFGTKNIREVLNIEAPRIFRVQEFHLPYIALILGVELGQLRNVLDLAQHLTLEQLQQVGHKADECVSLLSSSDGEGPLERKP